MGLGGYLCWTAAAREISEAFGGSVKILPVEVYRNSIMKPIKSPIFYNIDFIAQKFDGQNLVFPMQLNNPVSNYCKKDTPEKAVHRFDRHIIEQYCEPYGILNPSLKCVINLDNLEKDFVDANAPSEPFVVIDTSVNTEYTKNKFDNFEFWSCLSEELSKFIRVVHVGINQPILPKALRMVDKTTFRQAAGLIGRAELFIGSEGGLVHAATAFDTRSFVITTSFLSPELVRYPGNEYYWLNDDNHGPCGMKTRCEKCHKNMQKTDLRYTIDKIKGMLNV